MSWSQQDTIRYDYTGGAGSDELLDDVPSQGVEGSVYFLLDNRGSAAAYLRKDSGDTVVPTAAGVPAGEVTESGPYNWPSAVPTLVGLNGADVYVTPFVRNGR
jgi:hypothetical protein